MFRVFPAREIAIPNDPALIGLRFYAQGAFLEPFPRPGTPRPPELRVTPALEIRIE